MIAYYEPVITSASEYYPFGMMLRQASARGYRYGFNGKENDNEVKGIGNQQDYGERISDTRLGRFLSVDPLTKDYPWYTPYQFAGNQPIWANDLDGMEPSYAWQDRWGPQLTQAGDNLARKRLPSGHEQFIKTGITSTTPGDQNQQFSDFLDWAPWINEVKGIDQAATGKEWFTGRELSTKERLAGLVPYAGRTKGLLRASEKGFAKSVASKAVQEEIKSNTSGQGVRANNGNVSAVNSEFGVEGMFRRESNTGSFTELEVPMQLRTVKQVANQAGIGLKGINLKIVREKDMLGSGVFGYAHKKSISLYPDAFQNYETLVRTLGHERTHVFQFSLYGKPMDSKMLGIFETSATEIEDTFLKYYKSNK